MNGDDQSVHLCAHSLRSGTPLVVVIETGGAADLISSLIDRQTTAKGGRFVLNLILPSKPYQTKYPFTLLFPKYLPLVVRGTLFNHC